MKILIATDTYGHQVNGVANSVALLAAELRNRGHEVKVLSLSDTRHSYKDEDDYYVSSFSSFVYPETRISLAFQSHLLKELKEWKPDIVHVQTEFSAKWLVMKVVKTTDAPVVMSYHTDYSTYVFKSHKDDTLPRKLASAFYRSAYKNAKVLITPSEKAKQTVELYKIDCPISVIPNGISVTYAELTPEEKASMLKELGVKNNGKILVMVSRISKEKNIDEILSFMPALLKEDPEITLLIVGDGPHKKKLEHDVGKMGLEKQVIFTGLVDHDVVAKYYRLGDIFVCASVFETQGLTYFEAMSNGLPLVCRDDPCLKDVVDQGENGYTYTNCDGFVRYVTTILDNPSLKEQMSQKSLEKSRKFGNDMFLDSIESLYENVINGHEQEETE